MAASELGYLPNRVARGLRQQRTGILAHLTVGLRASFHARLAEGVQQTALDLGYSMILGTNFDKPRDVNYAKVFESYGVDGMVVVPGFPDDNLSGLAQRLPIVEVDRTLGPLGSAHAVLLDNAGAMALAVEHLHSLGHERIALMAGDAPVSTELERRAGFSAALRALSLPAGPVILGEYTEEGGRRASKRLFELLGEVSAVVVTTNEMLAGLVLATRERGLRLPDDLSVTGLDDARWTRLTQPRMTVVEQPAYEMGVMAVKLLVKVVQAGRLPATQRVHRMPGRLIVGGSTGPPSRRQT